MIQNISKYLQSSRLTSHFCVTMCHYIQPLNAGENTTAKTRKTLGIPARW